jgi:hypothetical protein
VTLLRIRGPAGDAAAHLGGVQVLLLTPLRSLALAAAARLAALAQAETRPDSIQGAGRLAEEFGPGSDDEGGSAAPGGARRGGAPAGKPAEHAALFAGNADDHFRFGIKITRRARGGAGPRQGRNWGCMHLRVLPLARWTAGRMLAGDAGPRAAAWGRVPRREPPLGGASPGLPPSHPVPVPGLGTYAELMNLGHPGRARRARPPAPLSRRGRSARRRGAVRLFAEFFQSDIIVASPLGLATALAAAAAEGDGAGDFLSSVEVAVADRADVMLMQNWAHVATGAPRPAPSQTLTPPRGRAAAPHAGSPMLQGSPRSQDGFVGVVSEECARAALRVFGPAGRLLGAHREGPGYACACGGARR